MEERIYKPGDLIEHLQVVEPLATGGFSAVYKVHDHKDNDQASAGVLKISRFDYRTLARELRHEHNARLIREYELLSRLQHQCIVQVQERGIHEGAAFYVMEWVDGTSLGAYLAEQRRSYAERGAWLPLPAHRQRARPRAQARRGPPGPEAGQHPRPTASVRGG